MVQSSDFIFGMTRGHVEMVNAMFQGASEKTFLIREFDDSLEFYEKDVSDPIGGSLDVYRICRDQIKEGIESLGSFVEQSIGSDDGSIRNVAIGSDHGGFELKERIKANLVEQGIRVADYGTDSKESTDYPDFARPVGEAVAGGQNDAGILILPRAWAHITANKIPGVRAALAFNEDMAGLAREHNNANVLCIGERITHADTALKMVSKFVETTFEAGGRHERRVEKWKKKQCHRYPR